MAKKLPFFKFDVTKWLTGKIQLADADTQGVFTNLCAWVWREKGYLKNDRFLPKKMNVPLDKFERCLTDLKELEIIEEKDGFLSIKFILEQLKDNAEFRKKCSQAGKKSAEVRKVPPTKKKEERRKKKEDNIKKINKKSEENNNKPDLIITNSLAHVGLPEKIKKLFIDWVDVRVMCHGKLPAQSQDGQIKRLLDIPADLREKSLKAAIAGTWKNIGKIQKKEIDLDDETAAFRSTGRE